MLKTLTDLVTFSVLQNSKGNFVLHGQVSMPFEVWPFLDSQWLNQWIVVFPNQGFEVWNNREDAYNRLTAA